ncbi:MAG TPA: hypothetical protein VGT44_04195 [Ktedonobacteraceae bacterium]|nr:hypothetical protein [Ktedonobacteraceae bacterium]
MAKQSTRSRSKQGQANNKPSVKTNSATTNSSPVKTNDATAKTTGGLSNGTSAKAATTPSVTPSTSAKAVSTQSKPSASGAAKQTQPAVPHRPSSKSKQQQRKQQKLEHRLAQQQIDSKQRRNTIILVAAALVAVGGLLAYFFISNASAPAETVFNPDYPPISGVYCDQLEQTAYHHHVLLTIYIDGQNVQVPAGVGLAGSASSPTCYYWLHTHDTSGIIHVEAPSGGSYSLQNFLSIWQSFANTSSTITYPSQLASSAGWTVYVNGKQVNEDFSHIDISSNAAWHNLITIMYNSPSAKPVTTYSWQSGL